jgi:hypothetical protein
MIIVAGGDSFTWGSELSDSPHGGPNGYSLKTFFALLAKEHEYQCAAYPGLGNREIKLRIIDACESLIYSNSQNIVLVLWTWASRDNTVNSDVDILELQQYLESHQIPFLFTCADNCIVTKNPKINYENWYLFPPGTEANETKTPRGFYQWAVENKYSIGPEGHPLEDAHRDAALLIKEKFNELVKKFI